MTFEVFCLHAAPILMILCSLYIYRDIQRLR